MNINPAYLDVGFRALADTLIHEIYHIMGFSPTLMEYYIDPYKDVLKLTDIATFDSRGNIKGIKTEQVLYVARKHFNCPYLQSVNFENEGGEGSAGAHWERSIMMNEMMTASDIASPRISDITLALMQDTGWYMTDFKYAENFTFFKNIGCKLDLDIDLADL